MATRIRLRRVGRKKQASFRIVVAGSIHANSGRVTETIGKYNPRTSPAYIEVDETRAIHWLREGAVMSESVRPLFRQVGILEKYAKGVEPEGVVVKGDPQGKTILATRPAAAKSAPASEEPAPAPKPEKETKPKAEAKAKAEKEPEADEEPKAEAKAEPAEEAAEEEPEAKAKKGGKAKAKAEKEEAEEPAESGADDEEKESES